ncbi:Uncharacterised protein [Kluyvera cryocrescens]|uniref:Uncharacterized protein n=1 Tax=Kluyvera cryocrescens TaxID=580 RepID=A0A485AQW5_KLUCR|nr:Uncharacterised protein [Kluyvera cryocrescens]
MRHVAVATGVQHRISVFQTGSNVVSVKDGDLTCLFQPSAPIMRMYIQLIGRIEALPNGAAETAP